ncbi:hypothetical protein Pla123a_09770 [Posidoniimonas polymericola]|uniref:Putative zinc-finger domain-containing protein n=1 Tax=Posidoniimonas polymericola TaxID=2528002 RepID=A0A5C5YU93_9BACT|nr:zf-HC2 domain-containing protein [Posidoniimonas polymericola]TWT78187.1 hypothetical protein Pla123a_09770 [Posidoniimonas polymericola]
MRCEDVQERLPEYVSGTLPTEDRLAIDTHLADGCQDCARECEAIGQAVVLLSESLAPATPPPGMKQRLFDSLDDAAVTPAPRGATSGAAAARGRTWLAYAVTAACAAAVGVVVTRYVVTPATGDPTLVAEANEPTDDQLGVAEWRRRVAQAEQEFGPPRAQLASVAVETSDPELQAVVYYDTLAQQMHVLVSGVRLESDSGALWAWFRDADQQVMFAGPLEVMGGRQAAGVVDVSGELTDLRDVLLTEVNGERPKESIPAEPIGRPVGRAEVAPRP